jgi:hypothetical protein
MCRLYHLFASAFLFLFAGTLNLPAAAPPVPDVDRLIRQLGSDDFHQREAASEGLARIGEPALAALRKAKASARDLEVRRRAQRLIVSIDPTIRH